MSINVLEKFNLKDKKSIVVGGAGDLGRSMVEALAEAGAQVVIIDIDDRMYDFCEDFKKNGLKVEAIKADISKIDEVQSSYKKALEILGGKLDILVSNSLKKNGARLLLLT